MKLLILVDKKQSAIDRLAQSIKNHLPHLNIQVLPFHPKRPNIDEIASVTTAWEEADLVHVSYWKSGAKFKEMYPDLYESKRKLLWHHNPYDIDKDDWNNDYKRVIVHNNEIHSKIPYAKLIPQGIDLDFYEFNKVYTDDKTVNMVVGRIEGKKGVKEVALACKELGYKFLLVGKISKREYFNQIMEANPDTDFRENITDEQLLKAYHESAIHVCNSVDGFESGTMPILEAMACGVPVLTRNIGHVPDMYNGNNMVVRMGKQDDMEDLKKNLQELMENEAWRRKVREVAWGTVKNRPDIKMALQFEKIYYELASERKPLVSVLVPTYDRPEVLIQNLSHIIATTYKHKEIIVVDSGESSVEPIIEQFRLQTYTPIKYIRFRKEGEYTLPEARNRGVVEASGRYILLLDERIGIEPDAIDVFVERCGDNSWLYGMKDGVEKGFVENFSFVPRDVLVDAGLFNERIDCYGGASEELRIRFGNRHGVFLQRVHEAKAKSLAKTSSKHTRKKDIVKAKMLLWRLYGTN